MNAAKYNQHVEIVTNSEKILMLARSPYFKRAVPLNDDHVVVLRHKKHSQANHPNYIGYYILEPSKQVGERVIAAFVGVRPKCYSIVLADGDRVSSAKGVPRTIKKKIAHGR